jgi:LEA14-like dessication related protein
MASPIARPRPRPPGIYRAARALRRIAVIVLVVTILFVALVAYSAVQIVQSRPQVGSSSVALEPNGTVGFVTSFGLSNPTYFPIQSFGLQVRIVNDSGVLLLDQATAVTTIAAQGSTLVPVDFYLPLSVGDESLLTVDQYLDWHIWGNATYGYLFPVSIGVSTERSWGAPFANLSVLVGTPTDMGGTIEAPITLSFSNDASFADDGSVEFEVVSSGGMTCATGSFTINVPPGTPYSSTQNVPVATGCDPSGGQVESQYLEGGTSIPLPPEPIP